MVGITITLQEVEDSFQTGTAIHQVADSLAITTILLEVAFSTTAAITTLEVGSSATIIIAITIIQEEDFSTTEITLDQTTVLLVEQLLFL